MDKVKDIEVFDSKSCLEEGKELFQKGDYWSAIEHYQKILNVDSNNTQALFEMGKAYYVLEKYNSALKLLEKAIGLQPRNRDIRFLLAKTYKSMKRHDDSIRELTILKKSGDNGLDIDRELKFVNRERFGGTVDISKFNGDYKLAIKECEDRLKVNPMDKKIISHMVQLYNFIGDYEIAREKASSALDSISSDDIFFRNRLLNELEIAEKKTILSSKIRRLTVTLSNRCNLSCIMCMTHALPWEIPKETIKEIFSLFPYLEKVMWQGGEVFVLDYFDEVLSYASQFPNLRQSIVTNGQLITEKMAEKLVRNNAELTFSVDGITKDVYEYIRKGANFEKLIATIKSISELRRDYKSNTVLNLNVAIMKSNYRQLEGFIDFAKELGFDFICLMPIHIHLKTPEDIFTNQDMEALAFITEASHRIEEKVKQYGLRLENRLPRLKAERDETDADKIKILNKTGDKKLLCHIPWQQLLIDYDGTVRPDCLCKIEKRAGSLLENSSLEEIWNNGVMVEYRKRIAGHDYIDFCNSTCFSGKISESHFKIP